MFVALLVTITVTLVTSYRTECAIMFHETIIVFLRNNILLKTCPMTVMTLSLGRSYVQIYKSRGTIKTRG